MVYSAEMRWFFKNQAEVERIEKWFGAQERSFANKWDRGDIYLWQPGLQNLSVKIREGKIEVKVLLADRGVVALPPTNSGWVNDWVKYSFELQKTDEENKNLLQQFSEQPLDTQKQLWVRVDKERLLIKFSVNPETNNLQQVPENSWPPEGCGVELTRIKVNQQIYYTFGLEAFSKTRQEPRNLELTLLKIISDMRVNNLQQEQSNAYPGFLQNLYAAS